MNTTAIVQIGIVVPSVDAVVKNYATLLGITHWNINYVDTDKGKGRNFHVGGKEVAVKAKIAWAQVGDIEPELIEPQDDTSIYAEYLRSNGPGVHHWMFATTNFVQTVNSMRSTGIETLVTGELQATEIADSARLRFWRTGTRRAQSDQCYLELPARQGFARNG